MKHAFFILFVFYCVNLFSATKPYGLQESQEQLKKRFSDSKKYPDIITSEALQYYVIKSAYDNADEKFYRSYPTSSDRFRLGRKVQINIYYTQCEQNKNMRACENLKKEMDFIGQLRGYENFKPKIIDLPNVDVAAKTFTVANGETYSFETGELVSKSDKSKIEAVTSGQQNPKLKSEPTTKAGSEQPTTEKYTDEKSGNDDSEYTCEWSKSLPRKIVRGSGCQSSGTRICTGYVTCGTKNRKADRLATCSESLCSDGQAINCSRQPGYGSKAPGDDDSGFTNSKKSGSAAGATQ